MAVVKGVKEQVHLPLYDCVEVKPGKQLGSILTSNVLRFFVDVNGKTKLLTNMQAASLLPHWNTFEARAMRVVISDLCPQFPEKPIADLTDVRVVDDDGEAILVGGNPVTATLKSLTLGNLVDLKRRLESSRGNALLLSQGDINALSTATNSVTVLTSTSAGPLGTALNAGEFAEIDRGRLEALLVQLRTAGASIPPKAQIFPNNGCGTVIGALIYNTVTTFFVGEKIMIQVPTWFFPAGAGPYSEDGGTITHGYPNPQATFRFAEPVLIETQQNFRVEIEVPESDMLREFQQLYGPLFIWVVLDGYMTRDVQ